MDYKPSGSDSKERLTSTRQELSPIEIEDSDNEEDEEDKTPEFLRGVESPVSQFE